MSIRLAILFLAAFAAAACSGTSQHSVPGEAVFAKRQLQIDIFLARGFLGGSEYERYAAKDGFLWRECGQLAEAPSPRSKHSSLEGDELLPPDPGLVVKERRVEKLSKAQARFIASRALDFVEAEKNSQKDLPLPGSVYSLSQPGLVELVVFTDGQEHRVVTSVDAVVEGETKELEGSLKLSEAIRGVGPEMCDAKTFYGIARRTP